MSNRVKTDGIFSGIFTFTVIMVTVMTVLAASCGEAYAAERDTSLSFIDINVEYAQTEARSILALINQFRTSNPWAYTEAGTKKEYPGLKPLTYDYRLEEAAMIRAAETAACYSHIRPNGEDVLGLLSGLGYADYKLGECLVSGSVTASRAMIKLREDAQSYSGQGHRRLLLDSAFTAVGIGHVIVDGVHFWTLEFGEVNLMPAQTPDRNGYSVIRIQGSAGYFSNIQLKTGSAEISAAEHSSIQLPPVTAVFQDAKVWPKKELKVIPRIVWISSNPGIVSVSGNSVAAGRAGSAVLTGYMGTGSVSIRITVTGSAATRTTPPPAVTTLTGRSSIYGVTLRWNEIPEADGYIIYSRVGNAGKFSYKYITTRNSFTDLNASSEQWNFYMVFPYRYDSCGKFLVTCGKLYTYGKKQILS